MVFWNDYDFWAIHKSKLLPSGKKQIFLNHGVYHKMIMVIHESMNLLHQSQSESEEDEEVEQSFVRAERRNREQQEWQFSLAWDGKSHAISALQASIEEPCPLAKSWQNTILHKNGTCMFWFAAPLYSALFTDKLNRICYGAGAVLSLWPLPSASEVRPGLLSEYGCFGMSLQMCPPRWKACCLPPPCNRSESMETGPYTFDFKIRPSKWIQIRTLSMDYGVFSGSRTRSSSKPCQKQRLRMIFWSCRPERIQKI